MRVRNLLVLALFIVVPELVGALGSLFTAGSVSTWYTTLVRPEFAPPSWVFGPVWVALYALMGVAAYRIYLTRDGPEARRALWLFAIQLVLNGIWTPIFFGAHALGWAFAEIVVLLAAIVLTIRAFLRVDRTAALYLAPYLAWVAYATALTYAFWQLN